MIFVIGRILHYIQITIQKLLLFVQSWTALMRAARRGDDSLIVMLLSANADGDQKNEVSVCICCCCTC